MQSLFPQLHTLSKERSHFSMLSEPKHIHGQRSKYDGGSVSFPLTPSQIFYRLHRRVPEGYSRAHSADGQVQQ